MAEEGEENVYQLVDSEGNVRNKSKMFTGTGTATYPNKDTYSGVYVQGYRNGPGTYVFKANGDTYVGEWDNNQKHGFGKMTYKDGADEGEEEGNAKGEPRKGQYLGYFDAGMRGSRELKKDVPGEVNSSEGTFTYSNGDMYTGQWKEGKKSGMGTYSYAKDGTKLIGEWESGKIVNGKWLFPNGIFYSGGFRYNKPFGKGIWIFPDGNQLIGDYKQREKPGEEEGGGEEEGDQVEKPDPKVWCAFAPAKPVLVSSGTMGMQKAM